MNAGQFSLAFAPLLPWPPLALILALAAVVALAGFLKRARGAGGRALAMGVLAAALLNPSAVREEREPQPDVAVIVVDESASQEIGERSRQSAAALAHLESELSRFDRIEVRVVRAGGGGIADSGEKPAAEGAEVDAGNAAPPEDGTRLFRALSGALADVPRKRIAGVVMITDGQVHDAPRLEDGATAGTGETGLPPPDFPLHVLLTGKRGAGDRRLVIEAVPRYGIVGQDIELTLRLVDPAGGGGEPARLSVIRDAKRSRSLVIRPGESRTFGFRIGHAGANLFEFAVEEGEAELTLANNRAVAVVNGVRDRLRVLLISGEPHAGERVWRNLLKSDPSVDLVHFTILRPPEKQDDTPVNELSLIAFPVRELFEEKLDEFDLVILDRYRRRGLVPWTYLENIVSYVRNGGALLEAVGPNFASPLSLYRTPLGALLPGEPTGRIFERGYRPELTPGGRRHPVTSGLRGQAGPMGDKGPEATATWGRWFRQIEVEARRGHTLMSGADGRPLLILDRFGEGRVAQLLSDHIWLWARGFEGGGPQAELLRRLAHWLMKEPELEENALLAEVRGKRLEITRHSLEVEESQVTVTAPSGRENVVALKPAGGGRAFASLPVLETGLYRLDDGKRGAIAASGALNPLELSDVRATADILRPVASAGGGGLIWIGEDGLPQARRVRPGDDLSGGTSADGTAWIGFRDNRDYIVTGMREVPLLPGLAVLLLALLGLILAWRREGR